MKIKPTQFMNESSEQKKDWCVEDKNIRHKNFSLLLTVCCSEYVNNQSNGFMSLFFAVILSFSFEMQINVVFG